MLTLNVGTVVRVVMVDSYGFTGRERHPEKTDKGFTGVIAGRHPDEDNTSAYVVCDATGRVLDLMEHEIEPVNPAARFRVWKRQPGQEPTVIAENLCWEAAGALAEGLGSYLDPLIQQES